MPFVADFSFNKPSPKALADAGYTGGIGYCSHDPKKDLTWEQIDAYIQGAIRMALVWETVNQEASRGHQAGLDDGAEFLRQAQAVHATGGVLWVVVEDPTREPQSDWPNIDAYLTVFSPILRAAGFQVGGYGSEAYLLHAKALGLIERMWFVGGWSSDVSPDLTQQSSRPGLSTLGGAVDCNFAPSEMWGWTEFNGPAGPPPPPPSSPGPPSHPGVPPFAGLTKLGSKGSAVRQVQARLRARGWKLPGQGDGVDGDFGPGTEKVVKEFQKEKGLVEDGIVGPKTWEALWTAPIT